MRMDIRGRRMLLVDWYAALARSVGVEFTQHGSGGEAYTLGTADAFSVKARWTAKPPFLEFVPSEKERGALLEPMIQQAVERVDRADVGGRVWYSTTLVEPDAPITGFSMFGRFLQRLGSQVRILGIRRLGLDIILEFSEIDQPDDPAEPIVFAPKAQVRVHIAAPGPCAGHFSEHVAQGVVEIVGAVCTFALGRSVNLPPVVFPSKPDDISELEARRTDPGVLTLARKGTRLDILSFVQVDGGFDVFRRVRNALQSFHAAVEQERNPVACVLFVVAAEALATPYADWGRARLTKRFIEFFDEMMPTDLDVIVGHNNFEEAFGIRRGKRSARALRREFLDRIYEFRSGELHEGLSSAYRSFGVRFDSADESRRGLMCDFAEGAILRYLEAPRTSVIGHPNLQVNDGSAAGANA